MDHKTGPVIVQFEPDSQSRERFAREASELIHGAVEGYSDATLFLGRLLALRSQGRDVPVCAIGGDYGPSLANLVTAVRKRFPNIRVVVHATERMEVRDLEILEGALHHYDAWIDVLVGRSSQNLTDTTRALVRVCGELAAGAASRNIQTKPYWLHERRTDARYPDGYPAPLGRTHSSVIAELTDEQVAGIDRESWGVECTVPDPHHLRHASPRIILPPNDEIAALVTGGPRTVLATLKGMTPQWANWLTDHGAEILGRYHRNTYLLQATPALLEELRDQPWCFAVHRMYPFRKVDPRLFEEFLRQAYVTPHGGSRPEAHPWHVRVSVLREAHAKDAVATLTALGGQRFEEGDMGKDCLGFTLDPWTLHAALLRDDIPHAEGFAHAVPSAQVGT
ncbi:MAG: hypothetical protein Q8R16_01670 [bacterium]|nr:hypothetical protein [bacterium]